MEIATFDRSHTSYFWCFIYDPILYYFRDKAKYWSKIAFSHSTCIRHLVGEESEYWHKVWCWKTIMVIMKKNWKSVYLFLPRDAMQARPMPSCGVCPSVCSYILSKRINVSSNFLPFLPSGSHTILVFPYQTEWQYSDGNKGIECGLGIQKSRFWAYIWLHRVLSTLTLRPARCYQHGAAEPWQVVKLIAG